MAEQTDVVSKLWPLDAKARAGIEGILDRLKSTGEAIGSWSEGSNQAGQNGVTYRAKFEKKVDVMVALDFLTILTNSPGLLVNACERLLAADDAEKAG